MSNQTNKKYQINRGSKDPARQLRSIWLRGLDSNQLSIASKF